LPTIFDAERVVATAPTALRAGGCARHARRRHRAVHEGPRTQRIRRFSRPPPATRASSRRPGSAPSLPRSTRSSRRADATSVLIAGVEAHVCVAADRARPPRLRSAAVSAARRHLRRSDRPDPARASPTGEGGSRPNRRPCGKSTNFSPMLPTRIQDGSPPCRDTSGAVAVTLVQQ
jgi:hypothetical protein